MNAAKTHATFRLKDIAELDRTARELGLDLPLETDLSFLSRPVEIAGHVIPNSMATQPMEGCDSNPDGAPGPLTFRRCSRLAAGGAGLLWFEACAVAEEGRGNPRQLWLHPETQEVFRLLLEQARQAAANSMGAEHCPLCVLQLTHSGRYSRPGPKPRPVIAFHDPILDPDRHIPPDYPVITDDELERLEELYVEAAVLAFEAGFDAVDIKACHRYLVNELLAAHTRPGRWGGSYENRTRFLKNVVCRIIGKIDDIYGADARRPFVACRLGVFDSHPHPYGWGVDESGETLPNLEEPMRLAAELYELGVPLVNITAGNPYFRPHINRPYDRPVKGATLPDEHPLVGTARLSGLAREIQRATPKMAIVGSGYSWLRHLWPYVAAAGLRDHAAAIVGLGRQAIAYPGFAKEILQTGNLDRGHTCIACSKCTQIMRDGGCAGCVPFDEQIYGPIYKKSRRQQRSG